MSCFPDADRSTLFAMRPTLLLVPPLSLLLAVSALSSSSEQTSASPSPAPTAITSLTPEQKAILDDAQKRFGVSDFAGALPELRGLHEQVPQNDIVTKFAAEAAVNTGENEVASSLLETILRDNPDDAQALGIQAHLYGQEHDVMKRDAVMDQLQKLHDEGKPAPAVVIMERDPLPDGGTVRICDYVEPQGRFHAVLMAEFYDATGQRIRRTALESDDIDQVRFRQDHPDQAAAGVRIYSMDSYTETRNGQGQITGGTHATLCPVPGCFMTGRPTYELFRSTVLATNKPAPVSSTTAPARKSARP
jgi:hypothetical protein